MSIMSDTKPKSKGKGCLEPFTPTFNYSNHGNYQPILQANNKKYTQKTFYDISQKNMETDTDKAKRRLEILFNHYGRHHEYFD